MHSLLHLEAGRARAAMHARIRANTSLPPGAAGTPAVSASTAKGFRSLPAPVWR